MIHERGQWFIPPQDLLLQAFWRILDPEFISSAEMSTFSGSTVLTYCIVLWLNYLIITHTRTHARARARTHTHRKKERKRSLNWVVLLLLLLLLLLLFDLYYLILSFIIIVSTITSRKTDYSHFTDRQTDRQADRQTDRQTEVDGWMDERKILRYPKVAYTVSIRTPRSRHPATLLSCRRQTIMACTGCNSNRQSSPLSGLPRG